MERKRKAISVETKLKILKAVDEKELSYQAIADKFNCRKGSVADIVKKRDVLENLDINLKREKIREGKYPEIESALLRWIKQMRSKRIPLSGTFLKEKAAQFGNKLNVHNFKPTDGWLDRFKKRNGLIFKDVVGEIDSVPSEVCAEWMQQKLPRILEGYNKNNVFNLDETGLFYRLLPNKTVEFQNKKCTGGKLSKERVTVLVGSNADGTEKLPLLVIGKSAKPRCFRNIRTLPVIYKNNKKAWMTHVEWKEYLLKLDKKFLAEDRKVLFIADNCPSHYAVQSLRAIKLVFLPPNTTAIAQPMDQGIIKIFKGYYRELVVRKIIATLENEEAAETTNLKISLLDALHFLKRSWNRVKPETINNCFRKAGFFEGSSRQQNLDIIENENLELLWSNPSLGKIVEDITVTDYVIVDANAVTSDNISDDNILNEMCNAVDSEEELSEEEEYQPPTRKEIEKSIKVIRLALSCGDNTKNELNNLHTIENALTKD